MKILKRVKPFINFSAIHNINQYVLTVLVISLVTLICSPLANTQSYLTVSFILLFTVSILATFMQIGPVLLGSTLSSMVWNFFFIPPHYTFHIDKTEDLLMFCMFFILALLSGVMTTRIRRQERLANEREKRTETLFQLTKELSKAGSVADVLQTATVELKNNFHASAVFILMNDYHQPDTTSVLPNVQSMDEHKKARQLFDNYLKKGKIENKPDSELTYYLLKGTRITAGMVEMELNHPLNKENAAFFDIFLSQVSNALEREFLEELAQKARFLDESDRLYKTLFNSISHELRIPVSTILGGVETLKSAQLPENIKDVLYNEISSASLRLNRLIENLLNMSRLESGRISPRIDWHDVNDIINKVTDDLKEELNPFALEIEINDEVPLVMIDFGLMEQMMYNLLLNACEHAPPSSKIRIEVTYRDENLEMRFSDCGPGFLEKDIKHVFNKFFRSNHRKSGGLGLGLSIVKGFAEAHKGEISVENKVGGGALFTLKIPSGKPEIQKMPID